MALGTHGNKYRAARDAGQAGRFIGWAMAGLGLAMTLNGMPGIFIGLTGLFIAMNARAEIMGSYVAEQLDGVTVGDLTWFGVAHAGTDMDADSMIWQRQRLGSAGAVAVMGDDGELDGLVLEEQLWAVPSDRRAMIMLTNLMVPFNQLARATPDEPCPTCSTGSIRCAPSSPCGPTTAPRCRPAETPRRAPQAGAGPSLQPLNGSFGVGAETNRGSFGVGAETNRAGRTQASLTDQSRLATGSLSLHGKLIHWSVRFHT